MGAALPERVLVLAIDIDNDLYRKTRLSGPVIGRESNLSAAAALALADPQDTDANTMFEAVRKYDELKKLGYPVHVVDDFALYAHLARVFAANHFGIEPYELVEDNVPVIILSHKYKCFG